MSEEDKQGDKWTYSRIEIELKKQVRYNADGKYLKLANELMYRIPVHIPTPYFEIDVKDLSQELKDELYKMKGEEDRIRSMFFKSAESVMDEANSRYYRESIGVYKLLHVVLTCTGEPSISERSLLDIISTKNVKKTFVQRQFEQLLTLATSPQVHEMIKHDFGGDWIKYIIYVILKEAKDEEKLATQILITLLSTYTQEPINMAIHAPSGEGKSYVLNIVSSLFPKDDIIHITGMSEKALFYGRGDGVIKDEYTGEWIKVELDLAKKRSDRSQLERQLKTAIDTQAEDIQSKLEQINNEIKEIKDKVKKLIDLRGKTLLFLDTPNIRLFEAIMPLLSHDEEESEYQYVDTNDKTGIKTRTNILYGFPAVVYCQAIDPTSRDRAPEIMRRFVFVNPRMKTEKYQKAIELMGAKFGMSSLLYNETVVSQEEKNTCRGLILLLKQKITNVCKNNSIGRREVIIPFQKTIYDVSEYSRSQDMTIANRTFSFCQMQTLIHVNKRPHFRVVDSMLDQEERENKTKIIPLSTFNDLKDSLSLAEYGSHGCKPFTWEWYREVYMPAWIAKEDKGTFDKKEDSKGKWREETRMLISVEDLVIATSKYQNKLMGKENIKTRMIPDLQSNNLIEEYKSDIDGREKKFYPTENKINKKLMEEIRHPDKIATDKLVVKCFEMYPTPDFLISVLEEEMSGHRAKGFDITLHDEDGNETDLKTIVDRYFSNPEIIFSMYKEPEHQEELSIISREQTEDMDYFDEVNELMGTK